MKTSKPVKPGKKQNSKPGPRSARKGYRQLANEDFEHCPIWELQNSLTTAEPYHGTVPFEPDRARAFFVRTTFTLADRSRARGWMMICVPPYEVHGLNPTILTSQGPVDLTALAKLPNAKVIAEAFRRLGKSAEQTFPLQFQTDVPVPDGPAEGKMKGFLHRLDYEDDNGWSQHLDITYLDPGELHAAIKEFQDREAARKAALEPTKEEKALLKAAQSGDATEMKRLIEKGVNPNRGGTFIRGGYTWKKVTSLMLAAEAGQVEPIRLLIEIGADLHAADDTNQPRKSLKTALLYAGVNNHLEVARVLLEAGADPNHRLSFDQTIFDELCDEGTTDMLRLLLAFGADPNASCGKCDYFALGRAVSAGRLEVVKLLLESGANIDGFDDDGETALIRATKLLRVEIFDHLLANGANVHAATHGKWTAFLKAVIVAADQDPEFGPEQEARFRQALKFADLLLEHGADINTVSKYGDTALSLAKEARFPDLIPYLRSKGAK